MSNVFNLNEHHFNFFIFVTATYSESVTEPYLLFVTATYTTSRVHEWYPWSFLGSREPGRYLTLDSDSREERGGNGGSGGVRALCGMKEGSWGVGWKWGKDSWKGKGVDSFAYSVVWCCVNVVVWWCIVMVLCCGCCTVYCLKSSPLYIVVMGSLSYASCVVPCMSHTEGNAQQILNCHTIGLKFVNFISEKLSVSDCDPWRCTAVSARQWPMALYSCQWNTATHGAVQLSVKHCDPWRCKAVSARLCPMALYSCQWYTATHGALQLSVPDCDSWRCKAVSERLWPMAL